MSKAKSGVVRVYNRSNQMIPIQLCPPKGDFFLDQQVIYIRPRQTAKIPKSHLNEDQINNLSKRRELQIIYDSEIAAERDLQKQK